MKNILLSIFWLIAFSGAFLLANAQSRMEKSATFYAEEAATTFELNDQTKAQVYQLKLEQITAAQDLRKRKDAGEFADQEAIKAARKEVMKPLDREMMDLLGVRGEDYWDFNKSVKAKMKEQKKE